ncbi:MAG: glycosyltransferase family 4 protein [Tissierellia bacterium]|nr:glycosyltransferase family 4 protein [Tissierellia bacterium]
MIMKTLWIIDHYASEPKHGGISRQYDFAIELGKRGYKVIVISSSFSHFKLAYIHEGDCNVVQVDENVCFVYLRTLSYGKESTEGIARLKNMLSFMRAVIIHSQTLVERFGEPDVVTGCSIHPFTWVAANKVAKKHKSRFVVEVRDLWPHTMIQNGRKSRYHPLVIFLGYLEKWAYKKADRIIYSMTYGDKYICDKLGFNKDKTFWIGQPLDCERFDDYAKNKVQLIPEDIKEFIQDSFVCVFAGYYRDYEGVYTMLEAAKMLKENELPIKMVFVGSGNEYEGMLNYVDKHNLNNVFIGQRISKEAIPALLKKAQICMAQLAHKDNQVYTYGTSKNKVNEYLYSGACTIFAFGLKVDPVTTANAGYVIEPWDSKALFETIKKVFEMPEEKRKEFGINGREYINKNHRVQVLVNKLEKILFE